MSGPDTPRPAQMPAHSWKTICFPEETFIFKEGEALMAGEAVHAGGEGGALAGVFVFADVAGVAADLEQKEVIFQAGQLGGGDAGQQALGWGQREGGPGREARGSIGGKRDGSDRNRHRLGFGLGEQQPKPGRSGKAEERENRPAVALEQRRHRNSGGSRRCRSSGGTRTSAARACVAGCSGRGRG